MSNPSFWQDTATLEPFPPLARDLEVDVVVVGGGLAGISAAYLLKKAGKRVALLERHRLAAGETGHTTAHLTCITDDRFSHLVRTFGADHAIAAWDAGLAAIHQIEDNIRAEEIACDFQRVPAFLVTPLFSDAPQEKEPSLREEARLLREGGFDADFVEADPVLRRAGVQMANQAKFHVLKYLAALSRRIPGDGSWIFEHSEASQFDAETRQITVNGHTVRCEQVVIMTHMPIRGFEGTLSTSLFHTKLAPYTTYAIGARLPKGLVPEALVWDTSDPYYYLRIEKFEDHDYAIFGGEDHKTGQEPHTEEPFKRLEDALTRILPEARPDHRWSGQVVETSDGLPFMGLENNRQFVATGFGGNGMTWGTIAAMMARDTLTGIKNPWSELLDPSRKALSLSAAWDYLRENKDYPYYFVKGLLFGGEAASSVEVRAGEGKVVRSGTQKIAVYRAEDGTLTKRSAICPHMGCVVAWNEAEKMWDCPCHGSRFAPTGEVVAGPAESSLACLKE